MGFSLQTRNGGGAESPGIFCFDSLPPFIINQATLNNFVQTAQLDNVVIPFDTRQACDLTGIVPRKANQLLVVQNVGASTLTLKNASGSSSAANRFTLGDDVALTTGQQCCFIYSTVLSSWLALDAPSTSAGGDDIFTAAMIQTGIISPAALAVGTTENYAPAALATSSIIRLTPNAGNSALGGLTAQTNGFTLTLVNLGAGDVTLLHASGGSTAANRFILPGAVDYTMPADDAIKIFYDATTARWRKYA